MSPADRTIFRFAEHRPSNHPLSLTLRLNPFFRSPSPPPPPRCPVGIFSFPLPAIPFLIDNSRFLHIQLLHKTTLYVLVVITDSRTRSGLPVLHNTRDDGSGLIVPSAAGTRVTAGENGDGGVGVKIYCRLLSCDRGKSSGFFVAHACIYMYIIFFFLRSLFATHFVYLHSLLAPASPPLPGNDDFGRLAALRAGPAVRPLRARRCRYDRTSGPSYCFPCRTTTRSFPSPKLPSPPSRLISVFNFPPLHQRCSTRGPQRYSM